MPWSPLFLPRSSLAISFLFPCQPPVECSHVAIFTWHSTAVSVQCEQTLHHSMTQTEGKMLLSIIPANQWRRARLPKHHYPNSCAYYLQIFFLYFCRSSSARVPFSAERGRFRVLCGDFRRPTDHSLIELFLSRADHQTHRGGDRRGASLRRVFLHSLHHSHLCPSQSLSPSLCRSGAQFDCAQRATGALHSQADRLDSV